VQEDVAHRLIAKGAYEAFEDFLVGDQQEIRQQIHSWAASGYRVLALVQSSTTIESIEMHVEKLPALNLIALMAFVDPIREDVPVAIKECLNAGVDVKMITGDHPATALYIAKQIGIATDEHHVMSGKQLTESIQKNGRLLFDVIKDKSVFARVTPEHKLQIVNVLKENGHYVAVTGDGVNDAPALKSANIGASMGYGTDVAKEASSMIVLNNSFHSIVSAIKEGRFIYSNIRKVVYLLISTGFAEIFTIIFTLLLQLDIPFTAIQLLWLNLVTNGVQDISLAFEKGDPLEMQKPPRKPSEPMFDKRMLQQVVVSAFVISVAVTVVWYYLLRVNGLGTFESRSIVMLLMVLFQNIHVMNCRNEYLSVFKIPFSNNYILIGAVIFAQLLHILVSHVPFLADVLSLQPYTWTVWWQMTLLSVVILVVMELYKVIAPKPVVNY
jgi:magnesium-transporting ATPase (P-type)